MPNFCMYASLCLTDFLGVIWLRIMWLLEGLKKKNLLFMIDHDHDLLIWSDWYFWLFNLSYTHLYYCKFFNNLSSYSMNGDVIMNYDDDWNRDYSWKFYTQEVYWTRTSGWRSCKISSGGFYLARTLSNIQSGAPILLQVAIT